MHNKNKISDLSPHLFWDTEFSNITWEKNSDFLVQRILEYGKESDWKILLNQYSVQQIAEIATKLRSLDEVALSFISTISKIPIQNFRCYTPKPSTQHYSGY